jgi:adenylate cyclase
LADERIQRRLAAILAADVVGYSRLMEQDETGTLARLKALRAELFDPGTAKYDGRIFKNTGDGALAEFSSAVDAVQSAVEIQRALAERNADLPEDQRITLRIGISLGDVIVEGEDLYGNGVNIAARMESLAEPGSICISSLNYSPNRVCSVGASMIGRVDGAVGVGISERVGG